MADSEGKRIWAELEADPEFTEKMRKAKRDFKEHRVYEMVRREDGTHDFIPHPKWPKDGEQPR